MKHEEMPDKIARPAQNAELGYIRDFETWLGYEFWSSQIEADVEQELFDFRPQGFISQADVMEIRNTYQITQSVHIQKERGSDALPF